MTNSLLLARRRARHAAALEWLSGAHPKSTDEAEREACRIARRDARAAHAEADAAYTRATQQPQAGDQA